MNGISLRAGDLLDATVTKVLPFGLLVQSSDGTPGLIRGASAEVGDVVSVRVVEYDAAQRRFHGSRLQ
jgi:predicted RNA-binding protein with RPS1 domain